jgi:DNA-binding XRE family transcriptional regulator
MSTQFIEHDGEPEYAVVPISDYKALVEKAEMLDDVLAYDRAKTELSEGDDEILPVTLVDDILSGANPIKVWRQYRGLSQTSLAERTGISQAYLAQLESGKREGTIGVYAALADALGLDIDDLVAVG